MIWIVALTVPAAIFTDVVDWPFWSAAVLWFFAAVAAIAGKSKYDDAMRKKKAK